LQSDTPGFTAVVKAGPARTGPFQDVSQPQTVGSKTTFSLQVPAASEYYLVWITTLPADTGPHYRADVNEVTAG
jgi:hypothetical protein